MIQMGDRGRWFLYFACRRLHPPLFEIGLSLDKGAKSNSHVSPALILSFGPHKLKVGHDCCAHVTQEPQFGLVETFSDFVVKYAIRSYVDAVWGRDRHTSVKASKRSSFDEWAIAESCILPKIIDYMNKSSAVIGRITPGILGQVDRSFAD